jgi:hypothetical protein
VPQKLCLLIVTRHTIILLATELPKLQPLLLTQLENCDIDFFVFRHHLRIMSPKFLKFERVQNFAKEISDSAKPKVQKYKIEPNWMKLLFSI